MDEFDSVKVVPTRVNLRARFPRSVRSIFARSFWFLLVNVAIFLSIVSFAFFVPVPAEPGPGELRVADGATALLHFLFLLALAATGFKLLYECVYHMMYSYAIELEHLTITKGVLFRTRASFPIAKINDVSLKRTPIELLFFVYSLDTLTASPVSDAGYISGLSKRHAVALQSFLLALVETTLPEVREREAEQVQRRDLSGTVVETLLHGSQPRPAVIGGIGDTRE